MGDIGKKMLAGKRRTTYERQWGTSIFGYATSKDTGWSVGPTISEEEVLRQLKTFTWITLGGFAPSHPSACIICYITLHRLLRSYNHKVWPRLFKQIEQGDLTVKLDIKSNNEIGQIATGLNSMVQKIQGMHKWSATGANPEPVVE